MKKIFTLFSFCLLISIASFAQTKGFWSESVSFSTAQYPNQTRTFAYEIPTSYTSAKKYKLFIAMHGQGDSPGSFIQTMWQVYSQTSIFGDAILVGPSEGSSLSGFTEPIGEDDGILDAIYKRVKSMYNIDSTRVYITGFSRGARSGLKIGLDNPLKYRGMLLYTPALLSLNEAKNLTTYHLSYTNGKFIPICMTVGASDPNGYPAIDAEVQNQLAAISNKSKLISMPGVGHNVPTTAQPYIDCFNFVESHIYTNPNGVNELTAEQKGIEIFPNPSDGNFLVGLFKEIGPDDDVTTTVYNMSGQKVYEQANLYIDQVHSIDLKGQPAGLYMVVVTTPHDRFVRKMEISK